MATKSSNEEHRRGHGGEESGHHDESGHRKMETKMYLRFAAMITTSVVVMYWTMFASTWEWSHVQFSESRVFMALTMGGTMGLVMLGWMLNMYKNVKGNIAIVAVSLLLLGGGIALDRSQATVDDVDWMQAMIPHHSMAITRSERADIDDVRVCQLAVEIIRAQEREIAEMEWLIEDIEENGEAETVEEAQARPVPEFSGSALRDCPTG
ncbi:DUF305 domain-containing protein [Blastococcus sp. BMG 814]|uniref:DUF305 domain-containing protein n=1 Tax=Blastococcus carthaginiensis TaxID=3050034 RepID=A0ABT9I965_9ACTN|nr:DUF305 domain-containing protein [Blastococcus carthaginiensis]MDP5182113.1 DUF305 domain-containing protein [Blastococcus carthaginiensis]